MKDHQTRVREILTYISEIQASGDPYGAFSDKEQAKMIEDTVQELNQAYLDLFLSVIVDEPIFRNDGVAVRGMMEKLIRNRLRKELRAKLKEVL